MDGIQLKTTQVATGAADRLNRTSWCSPPRPASLRDVPRLIPLLPIIVIAGLAWIVAAATAPLWYGMFGGRISGPLF
ncbi:MAG TPA: hypothetical protein VNE18_10615 [Rhodanobacter sp.]|nr:hypothetical protein [Rhodanobacter sp.]